MSRHPLLPILLVMLIATSWFSGCAMVQTYPSSARAGDTITLAIGSPFSVTRNNSTVQFTSNSDGVPVDLTNNVRAIFKLYPDKTSEAWLAGDTNRIPVVTGHSASQTVIVVDLPTSLPEGPGIVEISTGQNQYVGFQTHVNNIQVALDILPTVAGPGSSDPFSYIEDNVVSSQLVAGDLRRLEPAPQVVVNPVLGIDAATPYGAIELKIDIPTADNDGNGSPDPANAYIIVDDQGIKNLDAQLQTAWVTNGTEVTVLLLSAAGMHPSLARFSVVPRGTTNFLGTPAPTLSIRYFDVNGLEVTGPPPTDYIVNLRYQNL